MKHFKVLTFLSVLLLSGCSVKTRQFGEHWKERYELFANRVELDKGCDAAFIGDSITELYDLNLHYPGCNYVNRGISADTTDGLLERMDVSAYNIEPKCIYLMIGTNNLDDCSKDFETILSGIKWKLPSTKVAVVSIIARDGEAFNKKIVKVNNFIKDLTEKFSFTYIDAYPLFVEPGTQYEVNQSLFLDGLHPNNDGYAILTNLIKPLFEEWLAK